MGFDLCGSLAAINRWVEEGVGEISEAPKESPEGQRSKVQSDSAGSEADVLSRQEIYSMVAPKQSIFMECDNACTYLLVLIQ